MCSQDVLCRRDSQGAADSTDTSQDQESILVGRDKGVDERDDTERGEAEFEDDRSGEQVGQTAGEEEERGEAERVGRDNLGSETCLRGSRGTDPDKLRDPQINVKTNLRDRD